MEVGCARTRCRAGLFERGGGAILIAWAWCAVAVADLPTAEELPPPALEEQLPAEPVLLEPFGHTVGSDTHLAATWAEGLLLRSRGDDFAFRIGGRVQVDASGFTAGTGPNLSPLAGGLNPPFTGAANFRRARLRAGGRMY